MQAKTRVLVLAVTGAVMGALVVAWSSQASTPSGSSATRGSIAVAGAGLPASLGIYRRYPSGRFERLTANAAHAPAWSRDGRHIAFVRRDISEGPFVCALFVMNSDGSDLQRVGQVTTDCSRVSWGPGDRQIAFGGGVAGRINNGLWLVNVDGTGPKRLVAPKRRLGGRETTAATEPSWSPDGRTIVFGWSGRSPSSRPWPRLVGMLAAIRPDGSGLRVLLKSRNPAQETLASPAWSRDGKRLAFLRSGRTTRAIAVADARGQHGSTLVRLPLDPSSPAMAPTWSPNGRLIAYWSSCGKGSCVSTVPSRGGRSRVLMRDYIEPAWGPVGT